ncbi:hypothetical protein [Mesorhizobium sp. CAU 1741]|uniref:hypothetical protein n=1 Tax=Mesorhizobium sp. CAU 1741 TaxID=3140366 RepID=UPI00325C091B
MSRYEITGTSFFTPNGVWGAWLFVCGPCVSGVGYAILLREVGSRFTQPSLMLPGFLMIAGGLAFLLGAVMMLVGRGQTLVAREIVPRHAQAAHVSEAARWPKSDWQTIKSQDNQPSNAP